LKAVKGMGYKNTFAGTTN